MISDNSSHGRRRAAACHHGTVIALYLSMDETMRNINGSKEKKQVALEILAHVAQHPQAKDKLEGIAEWWIRERPDVWH